MNITNQERTGCEEYLYRKTVCCLHTCLVLDCPEPICAQEFPGGIDAYKRYKIVTQFLKVNSDIIEAARISGMTVAQVKSLLRKEALIKR